MGPHSSDSAAAQLARRVAAIALDERLTPRKRAALFEGRRLAGAVAEHERRFGPPGPQASSRARTWSDAAVADGRRLLALSERAYPGLLAEIAAPPIVLDARGNGDLTRPGVAIVGARRATPYGIGIAERFAEALAAAGYSIVSGLARGVDAAAHRGALRGGGQTVAVLGSAHDRLYPPEHRDLARRCAAAGVVVTEFPPGTRPLPHHFPRRNRIIAGLAQLTLVVEAAERSGSLSTARAAVESNRDVFAVPGPVGAPLSAGCHALLRDGAGLAASPEDILAELPPLENRPVPGADRESRDEGAGSDPGGGDRAIGGHAATVLAALRRFPGGVGLDDLLAHARLPVPTALAAVSELERRGRVRRFPGGFYRALR